MVVNVNVRSTRQLQEKEEMSPRPRSKVGSSRRYLLPRVARSPLHLRDCDPAACHGFLQAGSSALSVGRVRERVMRQSISRSHHQHSTTATASAASPRGQHVYHRYSFIYMSIPTQACRNTDTALVIGPRNQTDSQAKPAAKRSPDF